MAPQSPSPERAPLDVSSVAPGRLSDDELILADDDHVSGALPAGPFRLRRPSAVSNRLATIGGPNSFRSFARSWQRAASFAEVIPRRPSLVIAHDQRRAPDVAEVAGGDDNHEGDAQGSQYFPFISPGPVTTPHASLLAQQLERSPWSASQTPVEPGAPVRDILRGSLRINDTKKSHDAGATALPGRPFGSSLPGRRASAWFAVPPHLASPDVVGSYGSFRSQHRGSPPARRSFSQATGWRSSPGNGVIEPDGGRQTAPRGFRGDHGRSRSDHHRNDGDEGFNYYRDDHEDDSCYAHADDDDDDDDDGGALGEDQPLLVREVKKGDDVALTIDGQSTLPQSAFNTINALIGVGLLSLPLALKISGWLIGLVLLTLMALVATHTGKLLGRCMETDPTLATYSDLAFVSFGARARVIVSILFTLELIGASVALMILFADSLALLLPGFASVQLWKCICAAVALVLNALPLRLLSYTSVVGIFSTVAIVCIIVVNGFVRPHAPGSLREPAATHLFPSNWFALPLAYGLLASPWGAHCVFPSIYRDMRHPAKWARGVNISFSFSYALDTCLAIVGILMFGDGIKDMVTSNMLNTPGIPKTSIIVMCVFIAIIPLTKIPLNLRPLMTTADVMCGLDGDNGPAVARARPAFVRACLRGLVRVAVVAVLLLISILFPAFDSVCAFLGAALCSIISILLPISFYLRLYAGRISVRERLASWLLLAVFSALGLLGTVWSLLPKHIIGGY